MSSSSANSHYRPALIAIHWLTLGLLAAAYVCIEGREYFPRGSAMREGMKTWHFMLGLSVFALVWVRLVLRLTSTAPPIVPPLARWQHRLSRAMHVTLYAVMIGMPLGGWLILSAAGKPVPFFGLELPPLVAPDKALSKSVESIHKTIGNIALYLIALHAAAALYHHHIAHDNTLLRMLPWMDRKRGNGEHDGHR